MHDDDHHQRRIEEMEDSDEWEEEEGDDEQVQKSAPSAPQGTEGAPLTRQGEDSGALSSASAPPPVASLETEKETKKDLDSTEEQSTTKPAVAETLKDAESAAEQKK
jgi:hypothetical protein